MQARGEAIERLDERADVFALGSILCEVLTGKPAFVGRSSGAIQRKAALGDLGEAFGRLDAGGADGVLVGLAKGWLATEPEDRPRDAGVVAERLRDYLASIQERMRQAELAQAAASARAEEAKQTAAAAEARAGAERRARWLTAGLAAAMLALAALGGGGYSWMKQQRAGRLAATARAVNEALDQAVRHQGEARAAGDDLSKWAVALAQVDRADDLVKPSEADPLLRDRVAAVRAEIERGRAEVEEHARRVLADRKLLETLETIHGGFVGQFNAKRTVAAYRAAFVVAGLDLDATEPKQAGQWIAARTAPIEVAAHLDYWAAVHWVANEPESTKRLLAVARAADPDPWRDALRAKTFSRDAADAQAFARRLADDTKALDAQPTTSLLMLAGLFTFRFGDGARSERILRNAWNRDAGDFWVNYALAFARTRGPGEMAKAYPDPVAAVRFLTAAVATRPRSPMARAVLGQALQAQGKLDEAIAQQRTALRLKPDYDVAHLTLGFSLRDQGKLDEATAEFREALRLTPDEALTHYSLGLALRDQGKVDEAIAEFREAVRLTPDEASTHRDLGFALRAQGNVDEATAEFREALRLTPDNGADRTAHGEALRAAGKLDEAIAELHAALQLDPADAAAHHHLGEALAGQGKLDEAITEFQTALRLRPNDGWAHHKLGHALAMQGMLDAAVAEYREAIRINPNDDWAHHNLGDILATQGKVDAAVAVYRAAIRVTPGFAEAHCDLGRALRKQGNYAASLDELRTGHALGSKRSDWPYPSADWIRQAERLVALGDGLAAILRGNEQPKDNAERLAVAQVYCDRNRPAAAARLMAEALEADPKLGDDLRTGLRYEAASAAALAGCGRGQDEPPPSETRKAELRRQALDWLKLDLTLGSQQLATAEARKVVARAMTQWKTAPDLGGVRDSEALAKLSEAEREEWRSLWADVESLLKRAGGWTP